MSVSLTFHQIAKVERAISALDALTTLCGSIPADTCMENVGAASMSQLLDLITEQLREGSGIQ